MKMLNFSQPAQKSIFSGKSRASCAKLSHVLLTAHCFCPVSGKKIIQFCETTSVLLLKLENVAKNFTKVREQTFADSSLFCEVLNMQ